MRSFVAVLIIFFGVILLVIANALYVCAVCKEISEIASELEKNGDGARVDELQSVWHSHRALLSLSIELDEIERMNDITESLKSSHELGNLSEFRKNCRLIVDLCEEFSNFECFSINSILQFQIRLAKASAQLDTRCLELPCSAFKIDGRKQRINTAVPV